MPSSNLPTLKDIFSAFPEVNFQPGEQLAWQPEYSIVTYPDTDKVDVSIYYGLIHEVAHSKLDHKTFEHDIELLKMERDAWDLAKKLAADNFGAPLKTEYAEECLDSYRDWLYLRSKCPKCQLVGFQVSQNAYSCPHCLIDWSVPESRLCTVRRRVVG